MCDILEKLMIEQKRKQRDSHIKKFNSAKKALKKLLKENNITLPDTINITCIKTRSFVDNTICFVFVREDLSLYDSSHNLIKVFLSKTINYKGLSLIYNYKTQQFICGSNGIRNVIDKNKYSSDIFEIMLLNFIAGTTWTKQNLSQDTLKKIQIIDAEYLNNEAKLNNAKYQGRWSPNREPTIIFDDFNGVENVTYC